MELAEVRDTPNAHQDKPFVRSADKHKVSDDPVAHPVNQAWQEENPQVESSSRQSWPPSYYMQPSSCTLNSEPHQHHQQQDLYIISPTDSMAASLSAAQQMHQPPGHGTFNISPQQVEREPWRYKGYPAFSTWMASSDDFFAVRRFGVLHARTILMLQNEIARVEHDLFEDDRACQGQVLQKGFEYLADSGSFRKDEDYRPQRTRLLCSLVPLLERYDKMILYHSQLKARPRAAKHVVRNMTNWLENNKGAICDPEAQFVNKTEDLIAIVHHKKIPLRRFLESFSTFRRFRLFRDRSVREYAEQYPGDTTFQTNETIVELFMAVIVLLLGLGMLIGPAWWLKGAQTLTLRLEIICIFVPIFLLLLPLVVAVKPLETAAATFAYAAVLMVFMQIGARDP